MQEKANKYYKKLSSGQEVIDFYKLKKAGFYTNIIISQRYDVGKTMGAKRFALEEYIKSGHISKWVKNTHEQLKEEKKDFLTELYKKYWDEWKYTKMLGLACLYKDKRFIQMLPLISQHKWKGSRHFAKYIFYDEFNEGLRMLKNQTEQFDNLKSTFSDKTQKQQVFIFGNNKTMGTSLLIDYKIYILEGEVTKLIDKYGNKLILIIHPKPLKQKLDADNMYDSAYQLAKVAGTYKHMYLNESQNDTLNGVWLDPLPNDHKLLDHFYLLGNRYYGMKKWVENWKWTYYLFQIPGDFIPPSDKVAVLKKNEMENKFNYDGNVIKLLIDLLKEGLLWCDTIATKSILVKYF